MTSCTNSLQLEAERPVCSCECAATVLGLQQALVALQKRVAELEQNTSGSIYSIYVWNNLLQYCINQTNHCYV